VLDAKAFDCVLLDLSQGSGFDQLAWWRDQGCIATIRIIAQDAVETCLRGLQQLANDFADNLIEPFGPISCIHEVLRRAALRASERWFTQPRRSPAPRWTIARPGLGSSRRATLTCGTLVIDTSTLFKVTAPNSNAIGLDASLIAFSRQAHSVGLNANLLHHRRPLHRLRLDEATELLWCVAYREGADVVIALLERRRLNDITQLL
jgi:DNA-binding response OmpR family regulator